MERFSICTSVYKNDKPEFVRAALDSMLVSQSVKPSEIVLVQDGPVPEELQEVLRLLHFLHHLLLRHLSKVFFH